MCASKMYGPPYGGPIHFLGKWNLSCFALRYSHTLPAQSMTISQKGLLAALIYLILLIVLT